MANEAPVIIADYDPDWPKVFAELKAVISAALGNLALAIEHVGSTSVPGLPAKPIIDLDVVIAGTDQLSQVVRVLSTLGYSHQGDFGIPGREAFARAGDDVPRGGTGRTWIEHHLYVCAQDSRELQRHLAFRDHLRANPEAALVYGELKRALTQRFCHDREGYCEAKTEFVEGVLRKAMGPVNHPMIIRRFELRDTVQVARLFHETVRTVNRSDYTQEQVEAWAPADLYFRNWAEACSRRCTFVAEEDGLVLGFGELETDGHIDCFYVHHRHQRQGVGRSLYAAIEEEAKKLGMDRLFTEASITARSFFAAMGFQVIRQQTVLCRGVSFTNFVMEKKVGGSSIA